MDGTRTEAGLDIAEAVGNFRTSKRVDYCRYTTRNGTFICKTHNKTSVVRWKYLLSVLCIHGVVREALGVP